MGASGTDIQAREPPSPLVPSTPDSNDNGQALHLLLASQAWSTSRVFAALLALRIVNALTTVTFFQPDEYYQALEPAWQIAFGRDSGAWITWEWTTQVRSSTHALLFGLVYKTTQALAFGLELDRSVRASLLVAAPKVCQACFAAAGDLSTYRLGELVHGRGSRAALASVALTACSPWQWFCSTRTLSNSLETTLTAAALSFWPLLRDRSDQSRTRKLDRNQNAGANVRSRTPRPTPAFPTANPTFTTLWNGIDNAHIQLRVALLLAAFACVLRPTNALIWTVVGLHGLYNARRWQQRTVLLRETLLCGCLVFAVSAIADRAFYGSWTLPVVKFLYFNLAQDVAVFYGRHRGDYYVTEGLPLLLTTALPFAAFGLWQALTLRRPKSVAKHHGKGKSENGQHENTSRDDMLRLFAYVIIFVVVVMSLIAHKEVRFIYPLLPLLHVLAARPLAVFFSVLSSSRSVLLVTLLFLNLFIAFYTTQYHQRGVIDVLHYLRQRHEANPESFNSVVFLMPCHSTPWRSHLVHAPSRETNAFSERLGGLHARALTCEPPLGVPLDDRAGYVDQADLFYADPAAWLLRGDKSMADGTRCVGSMGSSGATTAAVKRTGIPQDGEVVGGQGRFVTPDALVFFAQLEPVMRGLAEKGASEHGYVECWRGFNSHWHDDWRRKGDVVVWCRDRQGGEDRGGSPKQRGGSEAEGRWWERFWFDECHGP